jgi:hypothetical protein
LRLDLAKGRKYRSYNPWGKSSGHPVGDGNVIEALIGLGVAEAGNFPKHLQVLELGEVDAPLQTVIGGEMARSTIFQGKAEWLGRNTSGS